MFKRVDRRRKRKEKEERLGLDEGQLEVFGLHHTDSSESESDSFDSASTSESSSDGLATRSRKKRKREASPPSYDEDGEGEDTDEEEVEGISNHKSHPPLTIASALKEPIRPDSDSDAWVCAFCPGKTLKHSTMVKVHEASRIHRQRFKRMQELAMKFRPDEDIQNVLTKSATGAQPKADSETLSHRAQKRAKLKERRKKIMKKKAIALATAYGKKATETVREEPKAGDSSDIDGDNYASNRSKVASRDPPRRAKNVHQTSVRVHASGKITLTDPGQNDRRESTKAPPSEKSKRGRGMGEQTTPTH